MRRRLSRSTNRKATQVAAGVLGGLIRSISEVDIGFRVPLCIFQRRVTIIWVHVADIASALFLFLGFLFSSRFKSFV